MQVQWPRALIVLAALSACSSQIPATPTSAVEVPSAEYDVASERIGKQMTEFTDLLVGPIRETRLQCVILATYRNMEIKGALQTEFGKAAFPESSSVYVSNCHAAFLDLQQQKTMLIAEPELVIARKKLSELVTMTSEFARYALDGGSKTDAIDGFEKKAESLQTEAMEALLAAKREYR
jgi:hypothetical protein